VSGGTDISLLGIRKSFGPVAALEDGTLSAQGGEVHALLGENGAGKTTLVEILAGMLDADGGRILLGGSKVRFRSPREAGAAGVGMVHQHFTLVPALTVLENVALGLRWDRLGVRLPLEEVEDRLRALATETGLEVDPHAAVETLSVGARQRVEILRVLAADPTVLVLDEPTAVLAPPEVESLFRVLRRLASAGRTVILIAHKLDEVLEVGDRFTVLRDGRTVFQAERSEVTARDLAGAMIGDDRLADASSGEEEARLPFEGDVVAKLTGVTASNPAGGQSLRGVDLSVHRGEILGVAGVEGNGQRELARVLAGLDPPQSGEVQLPERPGWIPQDRSREGLVSDLTLSENVALALHESPDFRGTWGRLDWPAIEAEARGLVGRFAVRTGPWGQRVGALSGGNSQKVVVGRELLRSADLLIAENPTRGLDLGATAFVHDELRRLRAGGREGGIAGSGESAMALPPGIVLISNDLDEILALSDRVLVLLRGRLTPVPDGGRTREVVGRMMLGMGAS
jgi:simple sugar transport system ATP-binding protein